MTRERQVALPLSFLECWNLGASLILITRLLSYWLSANNLAKMITVVILRFNFFSRSMAGALEL